MTSLEKRLQEEKRIRFNLETQLSQEKKIRESQEQQLLQKQQQSKIVSTSNPISQPPASLTPPLTSQQQHQSNTSTLNKQLSNNCIG